MIRCPWCPAAEGGECTAMCTETEGRWPCCEHCLALDGLMADNCPDKGVHQSACPYGCNGTMPIAEAI